MDKTTLIFSFLFFAAQGVAMYHGSILFWSEAAGILSVNEKKKREKAFKACMVITAVILTAFIGITFAQANG